MRSFQDAVETLNGRESRKVGNNTYLKSIDTGTVGVLLHQTYVVKYKKNGRIVLDSGGWLTVTTKARINEYSNAGITQKNNLWYMRDGSLFYDGIEIDQHGQPLKPKQPEKKETENIKLKKRIKKYCEKAIKKITSKRGMELPNGGDCWHCLMKTEEGKTMGDLVGDGEHLRSHIKDGYIVPALIWNAVREAGYQFPELIIGYDTETKRTTAKYAMPESITRALTKYLYRRLANGGK